MKTPMFFLLLLLPVATWCAPHLLHPRIVKAMDKQGDVYAPPVFCGNLVRISYDQNKRPDWSPSYFDNSTGDLIVECPGALAAPTIPPPPRVCPPAKWTCKE